MLHVSQILKQRQPILLYERFCSRFRNIFAKIILWQQPSTGLCLFIEIVVSKRGDFGLRAAYEAFACVKPILDYSFLDPFEIILLLVRTRFLEHSSMLWRGFVFSKQSMKGIRQW